MTRLWRVRGSAWLVAGLWFLPTANVTAQSQPTAATFDSDGASIRYFEHGAGEPVVLVHGFTLDAESNWVLNGAMDALAEHFRVVAIDARGHGGSMRSHDPAKYGAEMVADIERLMDHLGLETAHVVGYSMGGEIVMKAITDFPQRIDRAVVAGAGVAGEATHSYQGWEDFSRRLAAISAGETVTDLLFPSGAGVFADVINANDPLALAAIAGGMLTIVPDSDALRANAVPLLLVAGENDEYMQSIELAHSITANASLHLLPGVGHGAAIYDPGLVESILTFLLER